MTGYNKIKPKYKPKKKMAYGGDPDDTGINSQVISQGAGFAANALNTFQQPNKENVGLDTAQGALKGAGTGAEIGSFIGPEGTLIGAGVGALVGGVGSFIGGEGKKKQLALQTLQMQKDSYNQQVGRSNATLQGYNTTGTVNNQFYAKGGNIIPKYKMNEGGKIPSSTIKSVITNLPAGDSGGVNSNIPLSPTNPLLVTKQDGSIGIWGNSLQGTVPIVPPNTPKILPSDKAAGYSNTYYNGAQTHGQSIPTQVPSHFKDGGMIKPSHKGRFTAYKARTGETTTEALHSDNKHVRQMAQFAENAKHFKHADGGVIANPEYEAEKGETVQGQPTLEDSTQLASDVHQVDGDTHENGGTMGVGGDRVFSDRLKASPMLQTQLKAMRISVPANSTYADISNKLGKMKGKYEDKIDSTFLPSVNTGKKMIGSINNALDQTFNDQELQKKVIPDNKNMNLAYGGRIPKFDNGGQVDPFATEEAQTDNVLNGTRQSQIQSYTPTSVYSNSLDGTLPTDTPNYTPSSDTPANDNESILSRISKGISDNSGQLTNAGAYLANLGSINKLDTSVKRNYLAPPVYNYTNRSGQSIYDNGKSFNTGIKALTGSSAGVNGANVGALYASTLEANNRVNAAENSRKDAYDSAYNDRADRTNLFNAETGNQANDMSRDLNNQKNVSLPLAARNAFLQGVMGNNQVKANNKSQQAQMKIAALLFDKNNVLSRYKQRLSNAGLDMGDNQ